MTRLMFYFVLGALTLAGCTLVLAASSTDVMDLHAHWASFKAKFNKQYTNYAEEQMRFELFAKNKLEIDRFNAENSLEAGFTQGVNHFSDWTQQELRRIHENGPNMMKHEPTAAAPGRDSSGPDADEFLERLLADDEPIPDAVDWRKEGRVSPVLTEGNCSASFSFVIAELLEGQERNSLKNSSQLIQLSGQQALDCSNWLNCKAANLELALDLTVKIGGLMSEEDYPYEGKNRPTCALDRSKIVMPIKGWKKLAYSDEILLQKVVAKYGPVAVHIDSSLGTFLYYEGGIYTDGRCGRVECQNALLVGYVTNSDDLVDYWIIKNSWGTHWGEDGYIRMIMHRNMCSIAGDAKIATF